MSHPRSDHCFPDLANHRLLSTARSYICTWRTSSTCGPSQSKTRFAAPHSDSTRMPAWSLYHHLASPSWTTRKNHSDCALQGICRPSRLPFSMHLPPIGTFHSCSGGWRCCCSRRPLLCSFDRWKARRLKLSQSKQWHRSSASWTHSVWIYSPRLGR